MSNWVYIDAICDAKDFHCSVREDKIDLSGAKHPEIVLHKDEYLILQDEIKGSLKGLETITGGKGSVVCNNVNVPVDRSLMTKDNLIERVLLNHIDGTIR